MIGEKPEGTALRVNRSLFPQGTIFEVEHEFCSHQITAGNLTEITGGQSLPFWSAQHQKTVNQTFLMADWEFFRPEYCGTPEENAAQRCPANT
jgi:hypothetical protein